MDVGCSVNMDDVHTVEAFHGVYLLYCTNPKYKGRTYIGYTVDPNRRVKQHNAGRRAGGAWKTSNRGPWIMVLVVHGFPNDVSALRFEWAWQHPERSRRLQHVAKKRPRVSAYEHVVHVLGEMLRVGPWTRLPLTVRWLDPEYEREFAVAPPLHMPKCYGTVLSKKTENAASADTAALHKCTICKTEVLGAPMLCMNRQCHLCSHLSCLARTFSEAGEYVPIQGSCPECSHVYLWGDLVRKHKGWVASAK